MKFDIIKNNKFMAAGASAGFVAGFLLPIPGSSIVGTAAGAALGNYLSKLKFPTKTKKVKEDKRDKSNDPTHYTYKIKQNPHATEEDSDLGLGSLFSTQKKNKP